MGNREKIVQVEKLIQENQAFEQLFSSWQEAGGAPDAAEVQRGSREYVDWLERAKAVTPSDEQAPLIDMYEGGSFTDRVKAYLRDPLSMNPLYNHDEPNPLLSKWKVAWEGKPRESLLNQRDILVRILTTLSGAAAALEELRSVFQRFPAFLDCLGRASDAGRSISQFKSEGELQNIVEAVLRLHYDDVRKEDAVSSFAGASARVDFALPEVDVIVETKLIRPTLLDAKVGAELLVDLERYPKHQNCQGIFNLIVDPSRFLKNPAGLCSDLTDLGARPGVLTLVV